MITTQGENAMSLKASLFASKAHGDQKYGDAPYVEHLKQVKKLVRDFVDDTALDESIKEELYAIAFLHDVLEDTQINAFDIRKEFGNNVVDAVIALTLNKDKNRDEAFEEAYPNIRSNVKALIVKLADRICNMRFDDFKELSDNADKYRMYKREFPEFWYQLADFDYSVYGPIYGEILSRLRSELQYWGGRIGGVQA